MIMHMNIMMKSLRKKMNELYKKHEDKEALKERLRSALKKRRVNKWKSNCLVAERNKELKRLNEERQKVLDNYALGLSKLSYEKEDVKSEILEISTQLTNRNNDLEEQREIMKREAVERGKSEKQS